MKNNIVMSEFLNSDDFEKESNHMLGRFRTIVKPRFVDGFIYSFFEDFNGNPDYKKRLGIEKKDYMFTRNSNLFDAKSKTITLSVEEIDFINNGFFSKKLKSIYNGLYEDFDAFHRHFTGKNDFSLIEFYNSVVDYFKDNGVNPEEYKINGAFNSNWGNLTHENTLNKSLFKDETNKCNLNFISYIEEKIKHIQNQFPGPNNFDDFSKNSELNPFPDIFKSLNTYNCFKEYTAKHIIEPFPDYSYLFQRLLLEKLIHKKTHFEYMDWLSQEKLITPKTHDKMKVERNFRSLEKSSSSQRENNFNNIFEI
jgi:hypothetical protein